MIKRVVFATGNEGKVEEIRKLLADVDVEVVSMREAGLSFGAEENGTGFVENALIKARACGTHTGCVILADDSGLEIDALGGEPGIYSARYLGEHTSFHDKMQDLLRRMADVPRERRTARFVCAIAAILPDGTEKVTEGILEGIIDYEEKGAGGFGYDPIFFVPEYGCTCAEMDADEKNAVSHRGRALEKLRRELLSCGVWKKIG